MTEQATLPAGKKLCPGWTSEWPKPNGLKVPCGASRGRSRGGDQSLIPDNRAMCDRCTGAKKRWDQKNGEREDSAAKDAVRRAALVALYVDDVKAAIPAGAKFADTREFLAATLTAVDGLEQREHFPPHQKVSVKYGWTRRPSQRLYSEDKLRILRGLAALPLEASDG